MNETLRKCLDDLEARIDPAEEERLLGEWVAFADGHFHGSLFAPQRTRKSPPGVDWPHVRVNAALDDYDLMALQQYKGCSDLLAGGGGNLMAVRGNYGTGIIPSLFGVEPFVMPDDMDTLPTNKPFNDVEAIRGLLDAGMPDIHGGMAPRVFETYSRFAAIGREYPKIDRYVHSYHPDLQGPMDLCELLWGSSLFYSLFEEPELVKALLELVTQTYIVFMRAWTDIVPFGEDGNVHWGLYHRGNIVLRDDSAMNFSPDMFQKFIRPYDQRLLTEFGGGVIHFCGKGDHYVPSLSDMDDLFAINMSQPELNDMEVIFQNTVDKGIAIIGLPPWAAEEAVAAGRDLHGRVHADVCEAAYAPPPSGPEAVRRMTATAGV